jgi:hypothetical protein
MANENQKVGKDLLQDLKEALDIQGDFRDILKDSVKELQKSISTYDKIAAKLENLNKTSINTKNINADILRNKLSQYTNTKKLADLETKLTEDQKNGAKDFNDTVKKIQRFEAARIKASNEGNKQLEIRYISQIKSLNDKLDIDKQSLGLNQLSYAQALKSDELYKETNDRLAEELKIEKEVNKQLGVSGGLAQKFAQKLGLGEEVYAAMVLEARKVVDENGKATNPGKWKVFKAGIKEAGTQLKESLNDPLVQFGLIMKAQNAIWDGIKKAFSFVKDIAEKAYDLLIGWNSQIFEFAKNLGIGEQAARGLQNSFLDMANTSGDLFFNTKQLREAYSTLTEASGLFLDNNKETTETAAILQRQFGLTAEHFGSIMDNSALSGKSFKDTYYTIDAIRQVEGSRTKSLMSQRQMMNEMAKVSSLVLLNFKGNVPALAAAVVKAHALGLSLDQVNATTNGFLDFESSISKEFEAQLLTGKDLNLQRLRYLSLTHDTAGLMAEIGKRIPSMLEFEKMNTIERQSYAEAMNMSEESLAEIIKKQELVHKYGIAENATAGETYNTLVAQGKTQAQIEDILGKQAAQQDRSASIADRWNSIVDNIKDTLGRMLEGELGPIIKSFQDMLQNSGFVHNMITKIQGVVHTISDFIKDLPKNMANVLHSTAKWLWILAGVQAAIGASLVGLAFVTGGATAGAGAGLLIGAAKTAAVAAAAGYAAGEIETLSISPAAAANQVGNINTPAAPAASTATAPAMYAPQSQNLHVYIDGDPVGRVAVKYDQAGHYDNTLNHYGKPYNNSNSTKIT